MRYNVNGLLQSRFHILILFIKVIFTTKRINFKSCGSRMGRLNHEFMREKLFHTLFYKSHDKNLRPQTNEL